MNAGLQSVLINEFTYFFSALVLEKRPHLMLNYRLGIWHILTKYWHEISFTVCYYCRYVLRDQKKMAKFKVHSSWKENLRKINQRYCQVLFYSMPARCFELCEWQCVLFLVHLFFKLEYWMYYYLQANGENLECRYQFSSFFSYICMQMKGLVKFSTKHFFEYALWKCVPVILRQVKCVSWKIYRDMDADLPIIVWEADKIYRRSTVIEVTCLA